MISNISIESGSPAAPTHLKRWASSQRECRGSSEKRLREIYDEVRILKSRSTGREFPHVVFSGDTDMVTIGWVSLTSLERQEVVVAEVSADEWGAMSEGVEGYLQVERRINHYLGRTDLRFPWVIRVEERGPSAKGLSFQEFSKLYQPPRILYRDIFDPASEAEQIAVVGSALFESSGGKLTVVS